MFNNVKTKEEVLLRKCESYTDSALDERLTALYREIYDRTDVKSWNVWFDDKYKLHIEEDPYASIEESESFNIHMFSKKDFIDFLDKNALKYIYICSNGYPARLYIYNETFINCLFERFNAGGMFSIYSADKPEWLSEVLVKYDEKKKERTFKYITRGTGGLSIIDMNITKNTNVSLDNYNDDIPYDRMVDFCNGNDGGIMILNGEPGTGKTTLIKKLISDTESVFYFMKAQTLSMSDSEELTALMLTRCKNNVIVIEDCDTLLQSRETSDSYLLPELLNLSDGLLSDALKIKFILTYNTPDNKIDRAVLRKGRLRLKYEFKKLSADKVHNIKPEYNQEMTLADLYNSEDNGAEENKKKIGF